VCCTAQHAIVYRFTDAGCIQRDHAAGYGWQFNLSASAPSAGADSGSRRDSCLPHPEGARLVSGPLRPFWRPLRLRSTYVPPVLVTKC
jgi:hypothetical protein